MAQAYIDTALHFYELGNRYLQIDDVPWANIAQTLATSKDPEKRAKFDQYAEEIIYVNNKISDALPEDYTFTTHICRGNFRSTWLFTGGYDAISTFLGQLHVDGLFLEFDDERSGDFEKLGDIWHGDENKKLVLGLVTTKNSDLEDKDVIKARLADAANHVPLANLALSPQCGFASTVEGNDVSSESQWAKLNLIKEIAQEVWS
ncbi:5-methyltetrahydrofolate--homocysteine methyltransferase [Leuconostoc kimchii]|uniref:5-methyltetrahydrofolate--homocysteine methyltransferase n=1 Tax=Leuconostoc kimchii TaxID=136609 RepID=UPI003C12BDB4